MSNIGNKKTMAKNLSYYVDRSGKQKKEIAEAIGVAASTFNEWTKGNKYPRIDKIEMLSNYFGILKSDLIEEKSEGHRKMQKNNDVITDTIVRMRMDEDFLYAVNILYSLDKEKFSSVKQMLTLLK